MILKILTAFIIIVVLMAVIGLIKGNGRTKASAGDVARENKRIAHYDERIRVYENEPEHGGVSDEEYYYCCYMTDKKVNGYDLKKAVLFHTTCEVRGITEENAMKNILKYDEIYGEIKDDDINCREFYEIGRKISEIVQRQNR